MTKFECSVSDLPGEKTMEEAILSSDPRIALMGRMSASTFAEALAGFLTAELNKGTNPLDLLHVLAIFHVQTHASLSASLMMEGGFAHIAEIYGSILTERYVDHARRCKRALKYQGKPA